jgi:UDP-galactopyranose mutase
MSQPGSANNYDYLIVGAGFAGAVIAERLATVSNQKVLVLERRNHIGGNCYDYRDEHGVLLHKYGPHYFRTNSERVKNYLSAFTDWQPANYRVVSYTDAQYYSFPINLKTFEQFIGRDSTTEEMEETLKKWRVDIPNPKNSEEVIVSQVGWQMYDKFFKNYTIKQWKVHPRELDASVCGRIPVRTTRDERYFNDVFQALPKEGYTAMFKKMLSHPNIKVRLEADFAELRPRLKYRHLVYTGMIDEYYNYIFGVLPYRSLRFESQNFKQEFYQPALQVNYPNDHPYTRIVELKHVTGQKLPSTTVIREYPDDFESGKEAFYPIPKSSCREQYLRYAQLALQEKDVSFVGRLATYKYINMDQVVESALEWFDKHSVSGPGVETKVSVSFIPSVHKVSQES